MIRKEAVIALLGSPIAYYTIFAKELGGVEAGVFTSQFFYWYGRGQDPTGWIYKTQADIEAETGLSRRNQETARKRLRELKVLEEKRMGVPSRLFYRLNLDRLFGMMNEAFAREEGAPAADDDEDEDTVASITPPPTRGGTAKSSTMAESAIVGCTDPPSYDVQNAHPTMYDSRIEGCTDPPSNDARNAQTRMADSAIQESAKRADKNGGSRHTNTKTTTKTTTENTTKTTTTNTDPPRAPEPAQTEAVAVVVPVGIRPVTEHVLTQFQELLGDERTVNDADLAALADLATYPDHTVDETFAAARAWLQDPGREPIHALARWLVGTAQRKQEAERRRGNGAVPETGASEDWDAYLMQEGEEPRPRSAPEDNPWRRALAILATQVAGATYDSWLRDTWLIAITDDVVEIGVPNTQARDWLAYRMMPMVQRSLNEVMGQVVDIRFQVASSPLH